MPLSHLRPGHAGARGRRRRRRFAPVAVDAVEVDDYDGPVYDLEVDPTHTYVADGVLVHNSIYRFRGADIRNILEFEEAFPDATVIVLEQNYRSTQTILDAANAVIANNLGRKPKELWTDEGDGHAIIRYHADDEGDEAQWVAHEIAEAARRRATTRWGDMAVFYRTNAQSRVLEEHLLRGGHPVQGHRRHPLLRPARDQGRARLPAGGGEPGRRGVGQAGPQRAQAGHRRLAPSAGSTPGRPATATRSCRRCAGPTTPGSAAGRSRASRRSSRSSTTPAERGRRGPGPRCSRSLLDRSGYVAELQAEHSIEAEGRLENLAELVGSAREFESVDDVPRAGQPGGRHRRDRPTTTRRSCS